MYSATALFISSSSAVWPKPLTSTDDYDAEVFDGTRVAVTL